MLSYSKIRNLFNCTLRKVIIRNYRRRVGNRNNVGMKNRLAIFSEENPQLDKLKIDEQSLDELENELVSGKKIVDIHKRNIDKMKKDIDFKIIERKYFPKQKTPNFLTWAEKEQIRELYRSDPLIWTYDKLSSSFPATKEIIKKIIKSTWRPENARRIVEHDRLVSRNWEKLKKGEINLDPTVKQHLNSFSSRGNLQHIDGNDYIQTKMPPLIKGSEFASIITDYKQGEKNENDPIEINQINPSSKSDSTLVKVNNDFSKIALRNVNNKVKRIDEKMTTLEELRKRVKKLVSNSEHSEYDDAFLRGTESASNTLKEVEDYEGIPLNKLTNKHRQFETVAKIITEAPLDDFVPMKIDIPADVPKGSIYKVKDVYYDTDGKFLYRVPGMK